MGCKFVHCKNKLLTSVVAVWSGLLVDRKTLQQKTLLGSLELKIECFAIVTVNLLNLGSFKHAAFLSLSAKGTLVITPVSLLEFVLACMCIGNLVQ